MNKKFSTLMAGLLLAGGVFSVANASNWTKDTRYVQNSGKYFLIQQTGRYTGDATTNSGSWQPITSTKYYLKWNETEKKVYYVNNVNLGDKDAYWTVKIRVNSGQTEYQLVNANGKIFQHTYTNASGKDVKVQWFLSAYDGPERVPSSINVDVNTLYFYDDQSKAQYIYPEQDVNGDWYVAAQELNSLSSIADGFNNIEIAEEVINAADLNAVEKDGFHLNFKGYSSLEGNVFDGMLRAIPATAGSHAEEYYLYKPETDEYIVLTSDVWSSNTANLDGRKRSAYSGYKFSTVSSHKWGTMNSADRKATANFQIFKSYDFNDTDSLIVTMPYAQLNDAEGNELLPLLNEGTDSAGVRVFIPTVAGKNYVTIIEYAKANDRLSDIIDDTYDDSYEVGALAPYIQFGEGTIISDIAGKFGGKVWNITTVDGKQSLSPAYTGDIDEYAQLFAPMNQVDLTNPEGQWLLATDGRSFINRESGETFKLGNDSWVIRKTSTPDLYEICWHAHQMITSEWQSIYIREAKDAELGLTENGYMKFDMDQEANNGKYLSFETSLGVTAYIGKDADDNVILTDDASKAIEFRVKEMTHDYTDHDGLAGVDTLLHVTNYLNAKGEVKKDTLRFFQYAFYENFSEKFLMYNPDTKKFELSAWSRTDNAHEDFSLLKNFAFVVKEKEDGSYILIRDYNVDYDWCKVTGVTHTIQNDWNGEKYTFDNQYEANLSKDGRANEDGRSENAKATAHKAYAATQPGTLADMAGIYNYNDNDRITMENTNQVEYMKITGSQDTVKISLQAKPSFFLYEQGQNGTNFLGMEHVSDADMKAAILADTAYVRNNTYRPQYLLAVDTDIKPEIPCEIDGHPTVHPDTVYGRFLINAVDSANAWAGSDKTNPYIYEKLNNNKYYRLAFVDGYHTGDALTLNTAKGKTKIALDNNNDKVCTFAFRYVDEAREGVKIETTYDGKNRGWLKYQNNVPVVTPDYEDAHVFLVDNTTTEAPTANETIAAGNVVVAGTNGAVIVKGAEGKNVIVSTILGKVVANEVVSSDNATIAAPAGIVVVSVDGESFKVVVK